MLNAAIDYLLIVAGADRIHCIGDSHLASFKYVAYRRSFLRTVFKFCIVRGATASGILNPGSKTQGFNIFHAYLDSRVSFNDWILVCLGEVDCGYVIWYRSQKYNSSVKNEFARTRNNYFKFLHTIKEMGFKHIMIHSVPLPTIKNGQDWGEVTRLRSAVNSNLKDRTDLTLQLNAELREFCKQEEILFIDFEKHTLDERTLLVRNEFRHPNPLDHHLNPAKMKDLIVQELGKLGFR